MTKIFSGLLIILALGSCYRTAPDTSFDMKLVMPADSMVLLLTDLQLADAIISTLKEKKQPIEHLSTEYFHAILQKHAIDRAIFEESMRYYAFHTEELNAIYERVIINLSKRESMVVPEKEKDSLSPAALP